MRCVLVLVGLVLTACAPRAHWQGNQSLTRTVPQPPDSVISAATRALRAHGYTTVAIDSAYLMTTPHPVPQYARAVSTAPDTAVRQWLIQVQAIPTRENTQTDLTITAFLVPPTPSAARDSLLQQRGILVTSTNERLFAEVQRVGNWILDEMQGSRRP